MKQVHCKAPRTSAGQIPLHWFSPEEERVHVLTHGLGLLLSVAGMVLLMGRWLAGELTGAQQVASLVYGGCLLLLYAASTFYHLARTPHWRRFLRVADHSCIYLLIAGSYTPFTLTFLWGPWGWSLLSAVWILAGIAVTMKLTCTGRYERLFVGLSLLMGWLCVIAIRPMLELVPTGCLAWLVAGGLCYTAGVVFYLRDSCRWNHAVWHCCVLAGSITQFIAIAGYALR